MDKFKELTSQVDNHIDEIIELEQELVKIESVNTGSMPTGNETEACEYIRDWLGQYNIQSSILESVPGRGNIISKIEGENSVNGLMFMSHTDVVPVEDESKWNYPPFGGVLDNGRIYGRGASDCKGLLTSQMMAMRLLNINEIKLKENLILVSGADEEHGGRYGFGWLAEHHPEVLKAKFAINEGGGSPVTIGNNLYYLLGTGEKGRLEVKINVKGESSHASVPWLGENALQNSSNALMKIFNYQPDLNCSTDIFNYLNLFGIETKPSVENLELIIQEASEKNPSLGSLLRALSRMTITPTMINGGIKSNSVPEEIQIILDVRTLPHQSDKDLDKKLSELLIDIPNISYEIDYMAKPNSSPFETELTEAIKKSQALSVLRDDIQWIPSVSNGFTDSRFTRELDVITYGFRGTHPDDNPNSENVHGTDENYGIKSLISSTKTMLGVVLELCGPN